MYELPYHSRDGHNKTFLKALLINKKVLLIPSMESKKGKCMRRIGSLHTGEHLNWPPKVRTMLVSLLAISKVIVLVSRVNIVVSSVTTFMTQWVFLQLRTHDVIGDGVPQHVRVVHGLVSPGADAESARFAVVRQRRPTTADVAFLEIVIPTATAIAAMVLKRCVADT